MKKNIKNLIKFILRKFKPKPSVQKYIDYYGFLFRKSNSFSDKIVLSETERDICLKAILSYKASIKEFSSHKNYQEFIGSDWNSWTSKARNRILMDNPEEVFCSLGLRSYKTLEYYTINSQVYKDIREGDEQMIRLILQKSGYSIDKFKPYTCLKYPLIPIEEKHSNLKFINPFQSKFIEDSIYIKDKILTGKSPRVIEIGAGDGSLCRTLIDLIPDCKYIIFDLPEMVYRSFSFLSCHFSGRKRVGSLLDFNNMKMDPKSLLEAYDIIVLPCWYIQKFCDGSIMYDSAINCHSFGEMPLNISRKYISYIDQTCNAFFSVNREYGLTHKELLETDFQLTESGVNEYSNFKNMSLVDCDYPISSNPLYFYKDGQPTYLRCVFSKESIQVN